MAHPYWPLFDLEVRTPRLQLRYVDDELATSLVGLAAQGVHDPDYMPFLVPWTDASSPHLERGALQFYWRSRADTSPASWRIICAVLVDGEPVGLSDVFATDFPALRVFETGSWLGREHQGRGIGKEMRLASLTLGFVGLGAVEARTGAWHDNAASLGVTRSLGYEPDGRRRALRRGEPTEQLGFRMTRADFETIRREDITLHGVEPVRELLGLS